MTHISDEAVAAAVTIIATKLSLIDDDTRVNDLTSEELRDIARAALTAALPHLRSGEAQGDLTALRKANVERQAIWCPDEVPDLSFRGNELGGETGEALNVIKKLERERLGWRGSRDTKEHLAEELADVVICADLCAITAGIDLASAVVNKFNATSDKVGIPVKLHPAPPSSGLMEEVVKALDDVLPLLRMAGNVAYNMKQTTSTVESAREFERINGWIDEAKTKLAKLKDATP